MDIGMSVVFEQVLTHKPIEWQKVSYNRCTYRLFELNANSNEYYNIARYFAHDDIKSIKRVQHIYALGRYLLRKEQFKRTYGSINETFRFLGIEEEAQYLALEYNCDPRHYYNDVETRTYLSMVETPDFSPHPDESTTIIVVRHLCGNLPASDSNYYPAYLVSLYG